MAREEILNIKVYKTNVKEKSQANVILKAIRETIPGSDPSFDLEDCDNVLRIESRKIPVNDSKIRSLLQNFGHQIEELF